MDTENVACLPARVVAAQPLHHRTIVCFGVQN
jgi:hypothetical protein